MTEQRHPSSRLFYFVAVALGLSFSVVLVVLAWNNVIENETRNFAFDAIAAQNAVEGNFRAADAVVDNLGSFLTTISDRSPSELAGFTKSALRDSNYITGFAAAEISAGGEIRFRERLGEIRERQLTAAIEYTGGSERFINDLTSRKATIPIVAAGDRPGGRALFLVKPLSWESNHEIEQRFVVVRVSLLDLIGSIAVDPSLDLSIFTESEGLAGRSMIFSRPARSAGDSVVVEDLFQDSIVRLDGFSLRVTANKRVHWNELEQELVFVAGFLGLGVTLLLVALARAKDLQAQELQARNLVIEEQVRQQTRELAEARDAALQASRVKSDFLASMSHEIRTPLNAIIGMADLLSESRLDDEQQKYVSVFRNSGEALLSLVNDILDMSKIEAEQLTLEHIEFDLSEIIEQGAEIYALKADAKNIELVTCIAEGVPKRVIGDPGRLRQIVLNLIGNAIKFTEVGQIVVTAKMADTNRIHVEVSDSGIGIPGEKLESIFADFTQVDSSISRKYGGTGLGLAICKKLVGLMNGRIWVESIEGHGSRFQFEVELPFVSAENTGERPSPPVGINALIAVHNRHLYDGIAEIVKANGGRAEAANGLTDCAQKLAQRRASNNAYSLLILDSHADTIGNAADLVSQLRADGDETPAVALFRPSDLAQGVERFRGLIRTSYVVKPVRGQQLLDAIEQARSGLARQESGEQDRGGDVTEQQARIMLVEDNPDNRMLVKAYLKKEPYVIEEAENGADAVALFKHSDFSLVLMDVQMPVMDGYSATREIRAWELQQGIAPTQIIALTANAVSEDVQRSRDAGCDFHLTKPLKKQVLLDQIRQRLASGG